MSTEHSLYTLSRLKSSSWSYQDSIAPLQVVAGLWSFIEGELTVEPNMASHGYDDDFDSVDADGWNQYDSMQWEEHPNNQQYTWLSRWPRR